MEDMGGKSVAELLKARTEALSISLHHCSSPLFHFNSSNGFQQQDALGHELNGYQAVPPGFHCGG
jgi:hypothetical protein